VVSNEIDPKVGNFDGAATVGWLATPKRWRFVRGHDKPIHGSCAMYFPGGIYILGGWKIGTSYIYIIIYILGWDNYIIFGIDLHGT